MDDTLSLDWWMHQLYRQTKEFITHPTADSEARLKALIAEYRAYHDGSAPGSVSDEHERVMDYR